MEVPPSRPRDPYAWDSPDVVPLKVVFVAFWVAISVATVWPVVVGVVLFALGYPLGLSLAPGLVSPALRTAASLLVGAPLLVGFLSRSTEVTFFVVLLCGVLVINTPALFLGFQLGRRHRKSRSARRG